MKRTEREEEAFQSMFEAIRGQSIHAAPLNAAGEPAEPAVTAAGAEGEAAAAIAMPGPVTHAPRERVHDDRDAKIVQGRLWLISFTDLFSIILCFFLLIYSTKDPNMTKISALIGGGGGQRAGAGEKERGEAGGDQIGASIARVEYGEALNLDYLEGILKNALTQVKLDGEVKIANGRDHLKLLVDNPFSGKTALNARGTAIAKGLAERLNLLSNRITIVAHGGDWSEVVARSGTFAEIMRDAGYHKPFTVIGETTKGADIEIRVETDDGRIR